MDMHLLFHDGHIITIIITNYNWFKQSSICVISTFCRRESSRIEDR